MEELEDDVVEMSSSKQYWHQQQDEELMMMGGGHLDEWPPPSQTVVYAPADYYSTYKINHQGGEEKGPRRRRESMVNKLISTVYSGPTIRDIESALSFTGGDHQQQLKYISTSPAYVVHTHIFLITSIYIYIVFINR
jgi:hypothetical protein